MKKTLTSIFVAVALIISFQLHARLIGESMLSGRVVYASEVGAEGIGVTIYDQSSTFNFDFTLYTDANGHFSVDLPIGYRAKAVIVPPVGWEATYSGDDNPHTMDGSNYAYKQNFRLNIIP